MTRTVPWQCPEGLSDLTTQAFWSRVLKQGEHWMWQGEKAAGPLLRTEAGLVSAVRVAWALAYPKMFIPLRVFRNKAACMHPMCVNPEHYFGKDTGTVALAEKESGNGIVIPRVIEAMAHLQFGTPLTERKIRKLVITEPETLTTLSGPVAVRPLPGLLAFEAPDTVVEKSSFTREQIMEALFQPDTVVMTFSSGSVWISSPQGRVQADSPQKAILGFMVMTGRHKVKR